MRLICAFLLASALVVSAQTGCVWNAAAASASAGSYTWFSCNYATGGVYYINPSTSGLAMVTTANADYFSVKLMNAANFALFRSNQPYATINRDNNYVNDTLYFVLACGNSFATCSWTFRAALAASAPTQPGCTYQNSALQVSAGSFAQYACYNLPASSALVAGSLASYGASSVSDSYQVYVFDATNYNSYASGGSSTCLSCSSTITTWFSLPVALTVGGEYHVVFKCMNSVATCNILTNVWFSPASPATTAPPPPPPATTTAASTTTASTAASTTSIAPPPSPAGVWSGSYLVQSGCDQSTCCCLTGTVFVTQNGLTVAFSGSVAGQCAGSTTFTGSATLSSLSATTAAFTLLGENFVATRFGSMVSVANQQAPQCSGTASCTAGACLSPVSTSSGAATLALGLLALSITLAFLLTV